MISNRQTAAVRLFQSFLLALSLTSLALAQASEPNPKPFATSTLLIFVDTLETELYFVSGALSLALDQQAGPILASTHLLRLLSKQESLDDIIRENKYSSKEETTNLKKYFDILNETLKRELELTPESTEARKNVVAKLNYVAKSQFMLPCSFSSYLFDGSWLNNALVKTINSFNSAEWIIREVNADFLLLIPKTYLEKKQHGAFEVQESARYTGLEIMLGMQIDHMLVVESLSEYCQNLERNKHKHSAQPNLAAALHKIFVSHEHYANYSLYEPNWVFYIIGHGFFERSIVGVPIEQFKRILDFLETKIHTKLLVYSSCYAAGTNAELIYKNFKNDCYKKYSYAIATEALTDTFVFAEHTAVKWLDFTELDIDFEKKCLRIHPYRQFDEFVNQITSCNTIDYAKVLAYILPVAHGLEAPSHTPKSNISNLPQLRLPGSSTFEIIDTNKKTISIDGTWTLSGKKELEITGDHEHQPMGILLYTNRAPITLKINTPSMPQIIPMSANMRLNLLYRISLYNPVFEIDTIVTHVPLSKFLRAFNILSACGGNKIFKINSLVVENEPGKPEILHNIVIKNSSILYDLKVYRIINKDQLVSYYEYYHFGTNSWKYEPETRFWSPLLPWSIKLKLYVHDALQNGYGRLNLLRKTLSTTLGKLNAQPA